MSEENRGGVIDNVITAQVDKQIAARLSATQIRIGLDRILASDNAFLDLIDPFIVGKEDEAAKFISDLLLNVLIPDHPKAMAGGNSGRAFLKARIHNRLVRHLTRKGMPHSEAVAKVNAITSQQMDEAIDATGDEPPVPSPDPAPDAEQTWLQKAMAWLAANWGTILKVLLSLMGLLVLL